MIDDATGEDVEIDNFVPTFRIPSSRPIDAMDVQDSRRGAQATLIDSGGIHIGSGPNHIFDPFDPLLDADPFGLTASMHFPTQFNYDQSQARR